ncbi:MAG TPA: FtsQ-type POTRA domain-containing protein [Gemmatimonadaceae bacterium]|nr:FtsQ-type POTRA domain-containing protein [Gemmatimonadaceae bacterium]
MTAPDGTARPRRRWGRRLLAGLALAALAGAPWWVRPALSRLAYFRVRQVEVRGARYVDAAEIVRRLGVDTTHSVWRDAASLERRVAGHPQVVAVHVRRRLPGTLVVELTERLPVALLVGGRGMRAVDPEGNVLPIDPARTLLDLPVVSSADTALLRLLADLRTAEPALFGRVSEVRRVGQDEVVLRLLTVPVRAMLAVSAERLADVVPVEADLARRGRRAAELDLRYRDQVIARLQ